LKKHKHFRAKCLICPWTSEGGSVPIYEGYEGLRHVRKKHPGAEGFVVAIQKIEREREISKSKTKP
jgi:hypothetical protein